MMCLGNPPQLKGAEALYAILRAMVRGPAGQTNIYDFALNMEFLLNEEDYALISPKLMFTDGKGYLATAVGHVYIGDTGSDIAPGEFIVRKGDGPP